MPDLVIILFVLCNCTIFESVISSLVISLKVTGKMSRSSIREVPRWEIFMEQELRFGLNLGRMANFPAFIASKSFDL